MHEHALNKHKLILVCAFTEFKNHQLPLARIKKIMKSDEDVKV